MEQRKTEAVCPRVLVMTVGTGNQDQLEETLLTPLRKSIQRGTWERVILLPSHLTTEYARLVPRSIGSVPVDIHPLAAPGVEDDADACFAHFDAVLSELLAAGFPPDAIVADFTRGTKVMSAALVLAAMRHDLPVLRYITGARSRLGTVIPGQETIHDIRTTTVSALKLLDAARHFFARGNFSAALEILPDPDGSAASADLPGGLANKIAQIRAAAGFYATWDRLDYRMAASFSISKIFLDDFLWAPLMPTAEMAEWVKALAGPLPESCPGKAARLRLLAADILANGERRIRDQHFEDAVLRAYRVLELLGQIRLFAHGLDSANIYPATPVLKKYPKLGAVARAGDTVKAGRADVVALLDLLKDPLARPLKNMGEAGAITGESRNTSVLVHGFTSAGLKDDKMLRVYYQQLGQLLERDEPAAKVHLRKARLLSLDGKYDRA